MLLTLTCLATGGLAQSVRVRSGEHDGFTRLVVQIPPGTAWALQRRAQGAELSLDLQSFTFDTGAVFDRLSNGRLTALSQSGPGAALGMTFGCECVASAFLHRDSMIVVDIAPGTYNPPPERVGLTVPPELRDAPAAAPFPQIEGPGFSTALLHLNRRGFDTQLMTRLLQGADRNVLDLNLAEIGTRQSGQIGPFQLPSDLPTNLKVSSILDEISGLRNIELPQFVPRPACIKDTDLGFQSWSGTDPFSQHLAMLRQGLFQEFDRIDVETAKTLAKLYTFHGFGAEALQLKELAAQDDADWDRIAAIARLLDDLPAGNHNPFQDQQRCHGDAALWAALIDASLAEDAQTDEIEQAFARLPRHLKRELGPDLSQIFLQASRLEAARRILRTVDRADTDGQAQALLVKADIATAEGDDKKAETLLAESATTSETADRAALALARLIQKRWSDRAAITEAELNLSGSYSVQFRNSEMGALTAQSHAVGLSLNQEFDAALDQIPKGQVVDKGWLRVQNQILFLLAERADDITFLRHTLGMTEERRNGLERDLALDLSQRLTELGFAKQGFDLAKQPPDGTHRGDKPELRAAAAVRMDDPRQALLELTGQETEQAIRLRALALAEIKDFAGAAELQKSLGQIANANRNYWLAGALGEVAEGSGKYAQIAQLSEVLNAPIERQSDKPLADAARLLEHSAETRAQVDDLISALTGDAADRI